ncbi:glycosyltransferase [Sporosalibacterium faouarense]|uniref:glycosyltransferase n=1 Tax=Sporosalibacterium faouarense TaxID=516123 RepID=UPI00192B02B8|nr:glycosyltransferase [Sporosalibacterium faouarense]
MNILLVAMGLDIGGAETHVVSLAKELKNIGHNPVVISSGGVYVDELLDKNIPHYDAPLDQKDIKSIIKSLTMMKKAIKDEKIQIIHAHGRIPALIGKIISILNRLPFMTSAHAKFVHGGLYKYMSFWGEEVISVSEDIKNHLMDNFGVDEEKITIITNGIDTDKFSFSENVSTLYKDIGLKENSKKIVYISRIEGNLATLLELVIEVGQDLYKDNKDIELIIAGSGDDFERIQKLVNEVNSRFDKPFMYLLGKRTDIADIMSLGDVAICVSRTALESMACKRPVILAGGEGYMGLLNKDNIELAISNNFTGRTVENNITKESLENDIKQVLYELDSEDRRDLGVLGRSTVEKYFSIKSMTEETLTIYERLLKRR